MTAHKETKGDISKSLKYYAEALALSEKTGTTDTLEIGLIYNNLGEISLSQKELAEAEKYLGNASKILEKHKDNIKVLPSIVQNLVLRALVYDQENKNEKALEHYEQAIKQAESLSKEDSARALMNIYDNLGYLHQKTGKSLQAIKAWVSGLDSATKIHGADSMEARIFYENLAWQYLGEGKHKDALVSAENSLKASRKHEKPNSPELANDLFLLGDIYTSHGNPNKGLEYYQQALKIVEQHPEELKSQLAHGYMKVARGYLGNEELGKANEAFQKAIGVVKDDTNQLTEYYYSWAGLLNKNILHIGEAKKVYYKALEILEKEGGKKKERMAEIYSQLGEIAFYDDQFDEALKLFGKCLELVDHNHKEVFEGAESFLGRIFLHKGQFNESVKHFEKAIEICVGRDQLHADIDYHYRNLGEAYERGGNLEKAKEVYKKVLDIDTKKYGTEDETTQRTLKLLINVLEKLKQAKEIEELTLRYL